MKTEVLSSTVYLELNANQLPSAVAVSLLMVGIAVVVLLIVRFSGLRGESPNLTYRPVKGWLQRDQRVFSRDLKSTVNAS